MRNARLNNSVVICVLALVAICAVGCGGGSGPSITKTKPVISLTGVAPYNASVSGANSSWVPAGIPAFTLLANGNNFTATSVLQWNGTALATQFGTSQNLAATVPSAMVATSGKAVIAVYDPASGAMSGSVPFGVASAAAATAGVVQLITAAPDGSPANNNSLVAPSISATGRYVAFQSAATNLGVGVAGTYEQIYERDTCIGAPDGCAPVTIPITVTYDGSAPNFHSRNSSVSGDGRYVVYDSMATNILSNTSACANAGCIYLRDTCIGASVGCTPASTLISVDANGNPANGGVPGISPDGRFVTFASSTPNVAGNNPANIVNVFLRDTCNGAPAGCTPLTTLISQSNSGEIANERSDPQEASASGRFVTFQSFATNLIPNDTEKGSDIFVRDTCTGAPPGCEASTTIESLGVNGAFGNDGLDGSVIPNISGDGRYVAFASDSTNMVAQTVAFGEVYFHDTCIGAAAACTPATTLAAIAYDGSMPNGFTNHQSMSADGRYIAFSSAAPDLVPGDTFPVNGGGDIIVRDTCSGAAAGCVPSTVRISVANVAPYVTQANDLSDYPEISGDGHYVAFMSTAYNLLPLGNIDYENIFLAKTGY